MDNSELMDILMNNLELVNTLNTLNLELILYPVVITLVITLIIHIFKFSTNKLKESTLFSLVAVLIMSIATFASFTMSTYGVTLLQLKLGQFLILEQ